MRHPNQASCNARDSKEAEGWHSHFGSGHSFTTAAEAHISEVTAMAVTLRAMMVTASQPTIRNAAGMV